MIITVQLTMDSRAINTYNVNLFRRYENPIFKEYSVYLTDIEDEPILNTTVTSKISGQALNETAMIILAFIEDDSHFRSKMGSKIKFVNNTIDFLEELSNEIKNKFSKYGIEVI